MADESDLPPQPEDPGSTPPGEPGAILPPSGETPPFGEAPQSGEPETERVFGSGDFAPPVEPARPPASRSLIVGLIFALVVAATGAVVAIKAFQGGAPDLATRVPADSAAFARATVHPSIDQQRAIRDLLDRVPGAAQSVENGREELLRDAFKESPLDYDRDVKPWLGDEVGISISAPRTEGSEPEPVALLQVTDASKAEAALRKAFKDADEGTFQIEDKVAYIGRTRAALDGFRARAKANPLNEDAQFTEAEAKAGKDNLLFGYFDGNKLKNFLSSFVLPGTPTPQSLGRAYFVLRAETNAIVMRGHGEGATPAAAADMLKTGGAALAESTSAGLFAELTFVDFGTLLENLAKASSRSQPGMALPPVKGLLGDLGIDLDDLVAWTHGEFSVIFGGFSEPPIPDVGIIVEPTDEAALTRTLAQVRNAFKANVTPRGTGFDVAVNEDFSFVVRRGAGRLVIASTNGYARKLLAAAPDQLKDDTVYKRTMGGVAKGLGAQLFVRVDRIRSLIEGFLSGTDRTEYEKNVKPWLSIFEALTMRTTSDNGESDFEMKLSVPPR